ncbi:hypothetical protein WM27_09535 [Burkholderia ubonensis]|uniref:hypothetical protein n=1 Tax=Burkholderia ubonensis TaxID=101571 RepID=UPI00075FC750|nr:hypothetical protein [Burkholderia ubonensis]KWO23224.1 hypothetical protein WM27_09535 [Burkholderia ubonensis]ODQ34549.1 hypothetical protein BGV65_12255 [Burkholderia ubonensis]
MFEYRISIALDRDNSGRPAHVFTTEWMRRDKFEIAQREIVANFLPMYGYRITIHKRDPRMWVGTPAEFAAADEQ